MGESSGVRRPGDSADQSSAALEEFLARGVAARAAAARAIGGTGGASIGVGEDRGVPGKQIHDGTVWGGVFAGLSTGLELVPVPLSTSPRPAIGALVELADGRTAVYRGGGKAVVPTLNPEQMGTETLTEAEARKHERHRIAEMLERDSEQITTLLTDPTEAVRIITQLLRLE